jgi:hypothetical protein
MITQPRSAQPQINVFQGFDANTILKTRIPLCSFGEDEALLAHWFDQLLGCTATNALRLTETHSLHMRLAPKARHSSRAWGNVPGLMEAKTPSAEGAVHLRRVPN